MDLTDTLELARAVDEQRKSISSSASIVKQALRSIHLVQDSGNAQRENPLT
jgi:hypothetical protein